MINLGLQVSVGSTFIVKMRKFTNRKVLFKFVIFNSYFYLR